MHDLFRFLMLRPAAPVAPEDIKKLKASYIQAGSSHDVAKRNAVVFVQADKHLKAGDGLKYAAIAFDVASKLAQAPMRASDVDKMVKTATGKVCTGAIADARFDEEEARLADSLVAMKLLSDSARGDAPGLARIRPGLRRFPPRGRRPRPGDPTRAHHRRGAPGRAAEGARRSRP